MKLELPLLDQISVASPCTAPWEGMQGNDQVRFCGKCQKNVYNFSEMTRGEVEQLILANEGKLCGRLYRRPDGTLLTSDCPVGLWEVRARLVRAACGIAATVLALVGGVVWGRGAAGKSPTGVSTIDRGPLTRFAEWIDPPVFLSGDICVPVTPTPILPPAPSSPNSTVQP